MPPKAAQKRKEPEPATAVSDDDEYDNAVPAVQSSLETAKLAFLAAAQQPCPARSGGL